MTMSLFFIVLVMAVIGCGMVSGLLLAFSDFIMRSLKMAQHGAGIEVMQIINREIWRSASIFLLWGMVVLSVVLGGYAYFHVAGPTGIWVMAGGTFYIVGMLAVSYAFNIPMNHRLEAMEYSAASTASYWSDTYLSRWVFWNYIRAVSSSLAAICFLIACVLTAQSAGFGG